MQNEVLLSYIENGEEFDSHREEGLPVALCGAPQRSTTEGAAVGVQCGMQGVCPIVQDSEQFPQHPLLRHLCQRLQFHSQNRASPPDELVEPVGISCLHPAASTPQRKDDAGDHRVIKHLQHGPADVEWPESP